MPRTRSASSSPAKRARRSASDHDDAATGAMEGDDAGYAPILRDDEDGTSDSDLEPATSANNSPAKRTTRRTGGAASSPAKRAKQDNGLQLNPCGPREPPRRICLRRRDTAGDGAAGGRFIRLPHPRTGALAWFLLQDGGKTLLEALDADGTHRAWFVNDHVYDDGRVLVLAPIHPNFLLLPLLDHAKRSKGTRQTPTCHDAAGRRLYAHCSSSSGSVFPGGNGEGVFVQLDEVLQDDISPALRLLHELTLLSELESICDVKHAHGLTLYRLNATKAVAWLQGTQSKTC